MRSTESQPKPPQGSSSLSPSILLVLPTSLSFNLPQTSLQTRYYGIPPYAGRHFFLLDQRLNHPFQVIFANSIFGPELTLIRNWSRSRNLGTEYPLGTTAISSLGLYLFGYSLSGVGARKHGGPSNGWRFPRWC